MCEHYGDIHDRVRETNNYHEAGEPDGMIADCVDVGTSSIKGGTGYSARRDGNNGPGTEHGVPTVLGHNFLELKPFWRFEIHIIAESRGFNVVFES